MLYQRIFRLDIRKSFYVKNVVKQWNGLPSELVESPFPKILRKLVDVALRGMV